MRWRKVFTLLGPAGLGLAGLLTMAAAWGRSAQQPQHQQQPAQPSAAPNHDGSMPGMDMGNMDMGHDEQNQVESGAMHAMQPGHHMDGPHMRMTALRPVQPGDVERANEIASALRQTMEKYRDYRVALGDGYRIFLPNLPQSEYHFTNYWNGFLEGFTFDPARPTSLLYKKTPGGGWELIGAMYTAPRTDTLDQLNERVPLSMARWHAHINLCLPTRGGAAHMDLAKFGLSGSIATAQACMEAGGRFFPQIFGWMVHVYPFEPPDKIWAQ